MASALLPEFSRALDANGNPISGAFWKFYATGSSTPQAVYADAALAVSLGPVVEADAAGRFPPIYLDADLIYRGVQTDADGAALPRMDFDPINDVDTITSDIGLMTLANTVSLAANMVRTSGHGVLGSGAAWYVYDAAVDAAYVTANPLTSFRTTNSRGYRLAMDQIVTPQMFGAIADESTDSGTALNAWLDFIAENKVPLAAITGNFATSVSVFKDFNYGDGGYTSDKLFSSTFYCAARVLATAEMDHILDIRKTSLLTLVGHLHLMGGVDGSAGGEPWTVRKAMTGLYIENCGQFNAEVIEVDNCKYAAVETGPAGTNSNKTNIKHIAGKRVGSGPRDGVANLGQTTTCTARSDTGSANSFDQRSVLTVQALPPEYLDGSGRICEIRINGTGMLYVVKAIDRGAGTISVFPWLPSGVTSGFVEYYFGSAFVARGSDSNLINIGSVSSQSGGGALDLQCLYAGTYGTVHCEGSGVAVRIGSAPTSTMLGLSIGRLYCEGTTKDIRLNIASGVNMQIHSAAPIDWEKVESGNGTRDGALVWSDSVGLIGMTIGADNGGFLQVAKRSGATVALDFSAPRPLRQYIGTSLVFNLTNLNADLLRLFFVDGGAVMCRSTAANGGCTSVTFNPGSGRTVNGGASAAFGPYTVPKLFSVYANGTDWLVNAVG